MRNLWNFADTIEFPDASIVGYDVEATDGEIGAVEAVCHDVDDSFVVVTTGKLRAKHRLVPAGAVRQVSLEAHKVFLDVGKNAVEEAPDHDESLDHHDPETRDRLAATFAAPTV